MAANSPLNSMGIYTVFDRAPLPRIGDLPNGLAYRSEVPESGYTMLFVRATWGEVRQSCGERESYIYLMFTRLRACITV